MAKGCLQGSSVLMCSLIVRKHFVLEPVSGKLRKTRVMRAAIKVAALQPLCPPRKTVPGKYPCPSAVGASISLY